ncbi:MAG: hypothetical protein NTW19_01370 [Planctomycetota bacterium]|nr:hypothetical protein [Planctomycetota bacterium]
MVHKKDDKTAADRLATDAFEQVMQSLRQAVDQAEGRLQISVARVVQDAVTEVRADMDRISKESKK